MEKVDNTNKEEIKIREKRRTHYFDVDNDYIKSYAKHLGVMCTAVYTSLCMHSDYETQRCWPSMSTIAEQHGIERHTVSRALKKLEEWNIIKIARAIDRKNRKRKNNIYTLLSKEVWREVPDEEALQIVYIPGDIVDITDGTFMSTEKSHGSYNTLHMESKVPQDGTESSSNKTHIIKIIEEKSNCGQEPTISGEEEGDSQEDDVMVTWDYRVEILMLLKSDYKDYRIIGEYFKFKEWSFDSMTSFVKEFDRTLKPANLLKKYKIQDIKDAMKWCKDAYELEAGWTLETVVKKIDDCIDSSFFPQAEEWAMIRAKDKTRSNGAPYTPGKYKDVKTKMFINDH
jgi:DNA-binding MarR family transcriptional regulator